MRRWSSLLGLLVMVAGLAASARAQAQVDVSVDVDAPVEPVAGAEVEVNSFDEPLQPYGEWIYVEGVGRVWRPYDSVVGPGFRPYYSGGHWVYTDAGWTFVSEYPWGWAPFHYGHWWMAPGYGWVWLPGRHWAPAWVEWRYGGGYVGWAPAAPPGFTFGLVATWGSPWCFVETRYVTSPVFTTYVVPVTRVRTVYTVTQAAPVAVVRSGVRYSPGPPASHFVSAGVPVQPVSVTQVAHAVPPATVHTSAPVVPMHANPVVPHPQATVTPAVQAQQIHAATGLPAPPASSYGSHPNTQPIAPGHPNATPVAQPRPAAPHEINEAHSFGPVERPQAHAAPEAVHPQAAPVHQAEPTYRPQEPMYHPQQPAYHPQEPTYRPQEPTYRPQQPAYHPQQAVRPAQQPTYHPQQAVRPAPPRGGGRGGKRR